ncbi:ketoacyl-synt-domain-containing protein [Wolfiporia cocos MD-104 SS10]|uniref:Ketoacyl-synt-domain-containing protein n=1 Tax=Wolfiporia cocos (strain MD-104) TaxID=742152 RepID=A0A2H3JWC9_WOLCO|nr:ketoacyl-synt-domain-containing protein [Wolfiporia cocos MD-104 SS10]
MASGSADVYIFDGLGTATQFDTRTIETALCHSSTALGEQILLKCHLAFLEELDKLATGELTDLGLDPNHFCAPTSLLDVVPIARRNAVVAMINLFLIQLLRYICFERTNLGLGVVRDSCSCPQELLGRSSGMLAATVVAMSSDLSTIPDSAAMMVRLAFWTGLRCQQYVCSELSGINKADQQSSWSLSVPDCTRVEIQGAIEEFNKDQRNATQVYLTAVLGPTCVTVSGKPDTLSNFRKTHLPATSTASHSLPIHALFHAPELQPVKAAVMTDITRRDIRVPSYESLKHRLRSPVDGFLMERASHTRNIPLVEAIVDVILLHPVNFDTVLEVVRADLLAIAASSVRVANIGPDAGLWRMAAQGLHGCPLTMVDGSQPRPSAEVTTTQSANHESIAIVGMAVKFSGAENADTLWHILENGLNTVSEIPAHRFDVTKYANSAHESTRTLKTRYGNFLDDVDVFDNAFFRVSPREARSMDPQQRVLLHVAYHALEDAGYVPNATPTFDPETFGVYVGLATNDYVQNLRNEIDVYYTTGTMAAFLSGKVSYALGFGGPALVVDTACSSSVVAIYQACRALSNGDCNAAIAGGVNVITSPDMYMGLDRAHFLSPSGQCRPWDASANGYCRAEGCGMFVLKRLSDALAENDRILGVIRGVEVNQSGTADSITHPHRDTQVKLLRKVLRSAGVHPHEVSVVEAHGTGTQAGDPTEIESLRARAIPAAISVKRLNPRIADLALDNTRINTEATSWGDLGDGRKRLAVLNNYGAAGSNSALILEEPPSIPKVDEASSPSILLGFSAKTEEALERLRLKYIAALNRDVRDYTSLSDFAYTATVRRQIYRYRISVSSSLREDICSSLSIARVVDANSLRGKIIFVFSGQGGQYLGMGVGLYESILSFRRTVDRCHRKLLSWGFSGVLHILQKQAAHDASLDVEAQQSALFVLQYALATLWMSWGIRPDALAGHSIGEYAALVIADALSLDDALWLVAQRGRLIQTKCTPNHTGMLVVKARPEAVEAILEEHQGLRSLSIACYNSPASCVVAGKLEELSLLESYCACVAHPTVAADVPYGYHSSAMDPIVDDLRTMGRHIKTTAPSIPVLSCVHGTVVAPGDSMSFSSEYFARHCAEPVRFRHGIQALVSWPEFSEVAAWIEFGPSPITLPLIRSASDPSSRTIYLKTLQRDVPDHGALCNAMSQAYCLPIDIHWRTVFLDLAPSARITSIPSYPFARTSFWVPYREDTGGINTSPPTSTLAPSSVLSDYLQPLSSSTPNLAVFELGIDSVAGLISGHKISGYALCPASVYHELALTTAQVLLREGYDSELALELLDVVYESPLLYVQCVNQTMRVEIHRAGADSSSGQFKIISLTDGHREQLHCTGTFRARPRDDIVDRLTRWQDMVRRHMDSLHIGALDTKTIYAKSIYSQFSRAVEYSSSYQTMKTITMHSDSVHAYALVQSSSSSSSRHTVRSIFMDTLLHAVGFVLNHSSTDGHVFVCVRAEEVTILPSAIEVSAMYGVYCNIGFMSEAYAVADSYAVELDSGAGRIVARIGKMRFRKLSLSGFTTLLANNAEKIAAVSAHTHTMNFSDLPVASGHVTSQCLQDCLRDAIAETCGVSTSQISLQSRLDDLGIDSLMSIELASRLNTLLPSLNVSPSSFVKWEFVGDLVREVEKHFTRPDGIPSHPVPIVELQSQSMTRHDTCANPLRLQTSDKENDVPLILIHDGSGLAHPYSRLSSLGVSVWGVHNPKLLTGEEWEGGIVEMATHYVGLIKAAVSSPAYIVGGWSFGGVVAFEIARQLAASGVRVVGLLLIDSPHPRMRSPLPDNVIDAVIQDRDLAGKHASLVRTQMRYAAKALARYDPAQSPASGCIAPRTVMLSSREAYPIDSLGTEVAGFLADRTDRNQSVRGWEDILQAPVPSLDIPGNHFEPFEPQNVGKVSEQMKKALDLLLQ